MKAFSSLRSRIWLAVGATALPIFVFSLFGHVERREAALRGVESDMQHMLHMALVEERVVSHNARQVLRIMARSNELGTLAAGECNALAGRLLETQTDFANIGAVLPDGRLFCSGLPVKAPLNLGDRDWFRDAFESSDVSQGYYQLGRITGQRGVAYGYALRGDAGKVRAVLFAVTGTDWFDRMAEAVPLPRGWFALAADSDGHVLGRDGGTSGRATEVVDAALLQLLRAPSEPPSQRVRRDGSERIVGLAPLANAGGGIHLVIGAPTANVLEPIDRVLYRDLVIVGLVFLASALLGWLEFRRSFGAWADRLREAVRRIGNGEALPPSLAKSSVRELAELSAAFLQMKMRLDAADRRRREDEAAVRESEERLRLALETGNEALWDWDVATGLAYFSPTWYTMLGYEPDEFPASYAGWEALLHPADREVVPQRLTASIHGGSGAFEGSFRLRGKRGEWHWVQSRASVVSRDAHGRALRVVGTNIDVTEARLRDEEEQARADRIVVLLALNEYSARHDEKEFVAFATDAAEQLTGSELGFIHFVNEDQEHLDLVAWSAATRHDCLAVQADHYPVSEAGIWADCVRRHDPVVINDYPALTAKKGAPPGHVRMERLLTVPVMADELVVAVIGVANKPDDYGSQDVESLQAIGSELWRIVRGRRTERSLAESERRLREMLETVDLVAVILDREGRVVFVNDYWASITGWSAAEAVGEDWFARFLPDGSQAPLLAAFRESMARGVLSPHLEAEILTRDGGRRRIAWSNTLSRDAAGAIVGAISLGEDVTEKRRSDDALAASWERFYSIVNTITEAIFLHDAATGRIVDVNDAATAMYGFSREELMGTDAGALSAGEPPYTEEVAAGRVARAVAGEPQSFEWHARRRDGSLFWVEVSLRFAAIGGKDHVLAVVKDISERRAYEAAADEHLQKLVALNKRLEDAHVQLLQSEKMASIGQLAAGVAHEINNPVGYVFSNIGSLEKYLHDFMRMLDAYEKAEADLPEAARTGLERMRGEIDLAFLRRDVLSLLAESREGINRVRKIVQDLKDFSRVGSTDEWQWVDLHAGLDSTLNIVWNELKYKTTVEKDYGDLPRVRCLPSQINQVFMNLLVNAAHAIDVKGVVTVRTGRGEDEVWVEVEDTGAGIPPENLKRIFDPFFTTKPVGKGTGLGLSVSYNIVQKHRGRIEVRSEVGKGSTFRVCLPIDPGPETGDQPAVQ